MPWVYPVWDSLGLLDLGDYFLPHWREVFNYYLLKYFLMVFLFVFFPLNYWLYVSSSGKCPFMSLVTFLLVSSVHFPPVFEVFCTVCRIILSVQLPCTFHLIPHPLILHSRLGTARKLIGPHCSELNWGPHSDSTAFPRISSSRARIRLRSLPCTWPSSLLRLHQGQPLGLSWVFVTLTL